MVIASILLFIGILYLLRNLGLVELPLNFFDLLWPLFLIALGLYIFIGVSRFKVFKHTIYQRWMGAKEKGKSYFSEGKEDKEHFHNKDHHHDYHHDEDYKHKEH